MVCAGLWPLLDGLVRGGLPCYSAAEIHALDVLGLVEQQRSELLPTSLALEVLHQVAAHRTAYPASVTPEEARAWIEVLLQAGEPSERGRTLLAWLRLGTLWDSCYAPGCRGGVAGVARAGGQLEIACEFHRRAPKHWGALDQHLAEIGGVR